ncbi:GPI transamidase component PIG-S [Coccinella septempunctata]|uniref:GPI transamidase component PIG-S n=1 Tax=Coccinella septempunctata TaxID=41139 RepID=UPI001D092969|nr:GPI transamidase component PIG-S [Coccinella septempunctata]
MTVENAGEKGKKEIFPIEDEKSSRYRTYSILSYFIVLVIIGLPVWWYTTRVYRADLPLTKMSNLELESKLGKQLGIPLSLEYDILITVVNPEPQNLELALDTRQVGEALEPFLKNISSVAQFTVKSQWLYLIDLGVAPKKVENGYLISEKQLPHIITPLEKNLWSHISPRPCLNLVLYIPPCSSSPLHIYKKIGKENIKSSSNAMLSPSWGGIYIVNPSIEECRNGKFQPKLDNIVSTFMTQLKMMFDIKDSRNYEDLRRLYKRKASNMIESSKRTLKSLAQLLSEINSIVISDEVAEKIEISLESVENAELYLKAEEIDQALKFAKIAFNHSEKAFGDPSLLALLYFPDDQKYAVYIPLFLPIMIPVLMSLLSVKKKLWNSKKMKTE